MERDSWKSWSFDSIHYELNVANDLITSEPHIHKGTLLQFSYSDSFYHLVWDVVSIKTLFTHTQPTETTAVGPENISALCLMKNSILKQHKNISEI